MHHYGDFYTTGATMSSNDATTIFTHDARTGKFMRPIKAPVGFSELPDSVRRTVEKMMLHPDELDWSWSGDWFVARIWEDEDHFQVVVTRVEYTTDVTKVRR